MRERAMSTKKAALFGPYILVWCALLMLTGVTVAVAGMHLGNLSVLTAIFVAVLKSSLVLHNFMHLKNESMVFKAMLGLAIVTIAAIMLLTFVDFSFR
jgi:cytochrome c oxidase subunit 4